MSGVSAEQTACGYPPACEGLQKYPFAAVSQRVRRCGTDTRKRRTSGGEAVTGLILEVFRFNGRLLVAGDRLVSDLGLTSARWQAMGAIALDAQIQNLNKQLDDAERTVSFRRPRGQLQYLACRRDSEGRDRNGKARMRSAIDVYWR
jgi:hypothetical protein